MAVNDDHILSVLAGGPKVFSEQKRDGVGELTVRQVVERRQGGIAPHPQAAAYVGAAALQQLDKAAGRTENRNSGHRVGDIRENGTLVDECQFRTVQPQVWV